MGKLLTFERDKRPVRTRPPSPAEGQVVMFTGVRYQRDAPTLPDGGKTPARPKRKRG